MRRPSTGAIQPVLNWLFFACVACFLTLGATLSSGTSAQSFVQGFSANDTLQPGLVVGISKKSSSSVEAVPGGDTSRIYGVVIDPSDATVTVAEEGQDVFVATSGRYPVLVSIENGVIEAGDYLSISSTDGIAAKATTSQLQVVGRALAGYDGSSSVLTQTSSGSAVGRVTADISPGKNPLRKDTLVPGPLRSAAESIAGKQVSAVRLYGALAILLVTVVMAGSILWVGVRGGMTAIGRNPLGRRSVLRGLGQVLAVSVLIFVIGIFGVYLLLKL